MMAKRRQFGSIRRLPSGRWQARYREPLTNRLRSALATFPTKAAAGQFLARVETDLTRGTWQDPKRGQITFAEWVERYLRVATHKAATTRSRDEMVLRTHLLPPLGGCPLARITPLDVQQVVNEMSTRLAPATVRTNYGVLRAVLNAAVDDERIVRSPCRRIGLPSDLDTAHRALAPEELHRLAAAMPSEYRLIVYVGGVLGLRWSELVGLRVGRVNVLRRILEVAEAIKNVSGQLIQDGLVKSKASRRVLGIPDPLAELLAEHLALQSLTAADSEALVFSARKGGPLRYQNFMRRVWHPAAAKVGLKGVTAHDLRHTAATYLDAVGAPEQLIRRRLGHGSSDVTRRVYVHVLDETDKTVTRALGELVWRADAESVDTRKKMGTQASSEPAS
jgi:integrase